MCHPTDPGIQARGGRCRGGCGKGRGSQKRSETGLDMREKREGGGDPSVEKSTVEEAAPRLGEG